MQSVDGEARAKERRHILRRHRKLVRFANVSFPCMLPSFSWHTCCDFTKFDMLGSEDCFYDYPTWEMQTCCALSEKGMALFNEMLELKFKAQEDQILMHEVQQIDARFKSQNIVREPVFVVYRKTGHRFVQSLLEEPATLAHFLDLEEAVGLGLNTYYGGRAALPPFYQGWMKAALPEKQAHGRRFPEVKSVYMLANPLYSSPSFLCHYPMSLIVNLVRHPRSIVVSAYSYHMHQVEPWQRLTDPPSCLNCDYWAWVDIFGRCGLRCSYAEVLANSSVQQGLGIEVLRSRWQLVKMLRNLHVWRESPYVLHLQLEQFEDHFEKTFGCLLHFLLQRPPPAPLPDGAGALLAEVASLAPRHVRRRCEGGGGGGGGRCLGLEWSAYSHMSTLRNRQKYREEFARGGWERHIEHITATMRVLLAFSNTSRVYGCPRGRRLR